ncbi:MAG: hypothetical protein A3B68_06110 [Candidatus Melainabacteria bacterium RIFCSPHIGHO2_02_FULL_34_12]|nr:MAG: hypothetical protein A3B68_06110 [Candidatus Melainabacteria bacterium RIFCSPHIGHO2_02_FULL_34_12]
MKRVYKVLIDVFLFALSLVISYKLRTEVHLSSSIQHWYWNIQLPVIIPFVVGLRMLFLYSFQIYSRMWRYTEINEILELTKPIALSSFIIAIPRIIGYLPTKSIFAVPVSVIVIDSALSLIFLSFARILRKWQISNRAVKKRQKFHPNNKIKRTLMIGAGQAAQELARKIAQHPELDIEIICALDDDYKKQNIKIINDIKVIGQIASLNETVKKYNIHQIIIAIPSLPPSQIRKLVELCQSTKLEIKIIPGVDQLAGGKVTIEQIRKVSLEDLLGREPVDLSIPEVANFINDKTILITGAGGSIGSELTKQLLKNFSPKKVYILGRGENSIFQLLQELKIMTTIEATPIICDIRNYDMLYSQLLKAAPDVVFHAAAHKHVPLMEDHPSEAFENNVIGTRNIVKISGILGVKTFVNISTDKAVNPINVLGCTKRLAELTVNSYAAEFPKTKYVSVRFGNVIGSRGSVIPIWEFQLKNNLPISVTAKDAYRFFMTLSESAQLVIKAGAIGNQGEIMVLDMGDEINIYKLATDFIRLSGYDSEQVKLIFTGLRPGEKLKEELIGYYEGANKTKHKKILVIESSDSPADILKSTIEELVSNVHKMKSEEFKIKMLECTKKLNGPEIKPTAQHEASVSVR